MLRNHFIILILIVCSLPAYSQFLWLETTKEGLVKDRVSGQEIANSDLNLCINHHPVFKLDNPIQRKMPPSASGITVFSVYHNDKRKTEELVWKINENDQDKILHTTMRSANLMDGQFINFSIGQGENVSLTTYYLSLAFGNDGEFQIGSRPLNKAIPVNSFSGEFAEVIAFEKVLSPLSIQIVQSILALKYSLNLPMDHDYLGLQGEQLWDRKQGPFQHNIGGIGMLEEMYFNQQTATTKLNQGSFTCTTPDSLLSDNSFVLWANDQNPLKFMYEQTDVMKLDRQWRFRSFRNEEFPLQVRIDHKELINNTEEGEAFYGLMSGGNDFEVFPMYKDSNDAISGSVVLSHSESTFQLFKAPSFWTYLHIENPTCSETKLGKISGQILGGQAPYQVAITNPEGTKEIFTTDVNRFENIVTAAGLITIEISDQNKNKWQTSEWINFGDLPIPELADVLYLEDTNQQVVPYNPMPIELSLEWILPNGQTHFRDWIQPEQEGQYTLIVRLESCENRYKFEVEKSHGKILDAKVFPNPATSNTQFLTANLEEASPYTIMISDQAGRMLHMMNHPASQFLYHEFSLGAGVYIISLKAGNAVSNHPLIVLKN